MTGKGSGPLPVWPIRFNVSQSPENTLNSCKSAVDQSFTIGAERFSETQSRVEQGYAPEPKSEKLNDINDRQGFGVSLPVVAFLPPLSVCVSDVLTCARVGRRTGEIR